MNNMIYENMSDVEILLWDNASCDGSVEYLEDKYKNDNRIRIFSSEENVGFGKGINKACLNAHGEYLFLINSDVYFENLNLDVLLEQFQKKEDIGFLGVKILYPNGDIQFVSNPYPSVKSAIQQFIFFRDYRVMSKLKYLTYKDIGLRKSDWISGCVMICKKEMFDRLHGFDENIFMYNEDLDICARANKKLGFQNYVYDKECVYHLHGASANKNEELKKKLLINARVYKDVIERNELSRHSEIIYRLNVFNIEVVSLLRKIIKK